MSLQWLPAFKSHRSCTTLPGEIASVRSPANLVTSSALESRAGLVLSGARVPGHAPAPPGAGAMPPAIARLQRYAQSACIQRTAQARGARGEARGMKGGALKMRDKAFFRK